MEGEVEPTAKHNLCSTQNASTQRVIRMPERYAAPKSLQGRNFARDPTSNRESRVCGILQASRVPDVVSPACQCNWRRQDPKNIIIFCPDRTRNRRVLYEAAGTDRYKKSMSTGKGIRALAR